MIEQLLALIHSIYSIPDLIGWGGYVVLFLIIFAETGLFVGFFLPGDSLLITAGIFAAAGKLDIAVLSVSLVAAAIIGDSVGYHFGHKVGRRLFERDSSRVFKKKHILKAKSFYDRHGGMTIVFARFVPIIRTFAPIVAGTAEMPYRRFASFNIIGGVAWVLTMLFAGYFIGATVPDIGNNIGIVVIVVVALSLVPAIFEYARHKKNKTKSGEIIPSV